MKYLKYDPHTIDFLAYVDALFSKLKCREGVTLRDERVSQDPDVISRFIGFNGIWFTVVRIETGNYHVIVADSITDPSCVTSASFWVDRWVFDEWILDKIKTEFLMRGLLN